MDRSECTISVGIRSAAPKGVRVRYQHIQFYSAGRPLLAAGTGWMPPVDLYETRDMVVLEVNLAGIPVEQVHVQFSPTVVRISGSRDGQSESGIRCYHILEIERGAFARVLDLPVPVDPHSANAEFNHGLLVVRVAKQLGGHAHGCTSGTMEGWE